MVKFSKTMLINKPNYTLFNIQPKRISFNANSIYLNRDTSIEIEVKDGLRWIICGDPGTGKSYGCAIIENQFKNIIMFDPTGNKFKDTLTEQGYEEKYQYYDMSTKKKKNTFKINVADLTDRKDILDVFFPRAEDTERKRVQRQAVEHFLSTKDKNYAKWEELCEEKKLGTLFNDLKWILSPDDSAEPILFWTKGKFVIDCESISVRNPAIGVFIQSIIGARAKLSEAYRLNPSNFVMVGLDEAQDFCRYQTPAGNSFATLGLQARKFGLGMLLIGAAYDNLHPDIRAKSSMKFIFYSKGLTEKYKREGIDIIVDDWDKLPKHGCFLFSADGRFRGASGNDFVVPDMYFEEVKRINKTPESIVLNNKPSFVYRPRFFS